MEQDVEHPCPVCGLEGSLRMLSLVDEIPWFGEHTQVTLLCDGCGWRQTDFIPADGRKPGAHRLELTEASHLDARVVRSATATVRLPELDLEVAPGSHSHGYVTNVEGIITRFIDIVGMLHRQYVRELEAPEETPVEQLEAWLEVATALMDRLEGLRLGQGLGEVSVELLDPMGHSALAHPDATQRELTTDEVLALSNEAGLMQDVMNAALGDLA